jgi:hypothetical protein
MIRSMKALGSALLAVAAIGAVAASSAQAAPGEIHVTTPQKAVITGHGTNHVLKVGNQTVQCKTGTLEGTVEGTDPAQITAKHVTVTGTYQECTAFGFAATVVMNGCKYTLRGTAELTSQAQVVGCTAAKKIEIKVPAIGCTVTIGEQAELQHVTFTNDPEGPTTKHHLQDHETVGGIVYTRDGGLCPQGEATYSGTTTLKAYKDLGTKPVKKHEHEYLEHLCGEEVGILGT